MNTENTVNKTIIAGRVLEEFSFSHEIFGEKFYSTKVSIQRLSGTEDIIPVLIREEFYKEGIKDTYIKVIGQFRSYNYMGDDNRSHLKLLVFGTNVEFNPQIQYENEIQLRGFVTKPIKLRSTPFGRQISDICLAVNRNYRKSDYIPCIAWGANATFAEQLSVGTQIEVLGRIQSREYIKDNELRVAYEVSISEINVMP